MKIHLAGLKLVTCWPPDTVMQTGTFSQPFITNMLQPTCMHPYFITLSHFHSPVCKDIPNLNFTHLTFYIHYSLTQVSIKILSILWSEVASGNIKYVASTQFFLTANEQINPYVWISTCYKLHHNQCLQNYYCFSSFLIMRLSEENLKWRECYQGNGIWDHGTLKLNK
jgi:hypothetical protein